MKRTENILVVDDDDNLRESIVTILECEGYILDAAKNGLEAEHKIKNNNYNLILIDIKLPDISGVELLKRANKYTPRTKKIMLTGYPDTETAIKSVNEKANGYLVKPFNSDDLIKIIYTNLEQQKEELEYTQKKVLEYIRSRVHELDTQFDEKTDNFNLKNEY